MRVKQEIIHAKALQICLKMVLEEGKSIEEALTHFPDLADKLRVDLVTALWLNGQKYMFQSRSGFIHFSRSRTMHQIDSGKSKKIIEKRKNLFIRPVYRYAFTLLLVFSILFSTTSLAFAGTLPGDTLYPVKLTWEETRLLLNQDVTKEIRLHLRFADNRIDEALRLVNRGNFDNLAEIFENYHQHTTDAYVPLIELSGQDQAEELVDEFTNKVSEHILILHVLQSEIPAEVASSIDPIIETLETELKSFDPELPETDTSLSPDDDGPSTENPESHSGEEAVSGLDDGNSGGIVGDENDGNDKVNDEDGNGEARIGEGESETNKGANGDNEGGNQGVGNDEDKDNNPEDGNQGVGNDEDRDNNPEDGNQGIGNDDKVNNPNKGPENNSGQNQDKGNSSSDGNQGGGNDEIQGEDSDDGNQGNGNDNKDKDKNK